MLTPTLPARWQELFGLEPELEATMTRDERRDAVSLLVDEAERLAREEFQYAAENPDPRRSFMWDPLDYICNVLEISRVKLSRYTLEATGMRAHEVTDKIKAAALPDILKQRYAKQFEAMKPILESMFPIVPDADLDDIEERALNWTLKAFRDSRLGQGRIIFAIELGYANPSRLFKACQLAHRTTIPAIEEECARTLVQKFFEQRKSALTPNPSPARGEGSREEEAPNAQAVPPSPLSGEGPEVRASAGPEVKAAVDALKAELGLEGELSDDEKEILEAMLKEHAA